MEIKEIKKKLLDNHNIILHGAPGTGKTYLAKEIAKAMCGNVEDFKKLEDSGQFKMVQFHPSYDYTDFVEGLRPEDDGKGNIVFKRKDGVFKEFCKKAIENKLLGSKEIAQTLSFEDTYNSLIKKVENLIKEGNTPTFKWGKRDSEVSIKDGKLRYQDAKKEPKSEFGQMEPLFNYFVQNNQYDIRTLKPCELNDIVKNKLNNDTKGVDFPPYHWTLTELLNIAKNKVCVSNFDTHHFIFLIDEINRGDMSKIFGELFFAIDPGYRGEKGKIDTQYQNLVEENDEFKKGFYVPSNVYIIGTMNDIDRSVDSMDFAMRRRFQFIEVTVKSRAEDMFKDDNGHSLSNAEDAKGIMTNLNNCIISKEIGLSKSYQIGGAYFKKFATGEENAQSLWDYSLKGLLREYLRGEEEEAINNKLEILYKAYKKENEYSEEGKLVTKANQSQPSEPELNAQ